MNKIEELENRVEELECSLREVRTALGLDTKVVLQELPLALLPPDGPLNKPKQTLNGGGQVLMKKPVMYLYNFTGDTLNCNVDFKTNIIADSVPEIRKDNKLPFALDSDSFINDKYSYLYYEFDITGNEPKSNANTFIRNNKHLDQDLEKLARMVGLVSNEVTDFVTYWSLELKRSDTPFYKCEIFGEDKLEKLFPIDIFPVPDFLVRRYVKFIPVDKMGKGNITVEQFRPKARTGALRVCEWGGFIAGEGKVR